MTLDLEPGFVILGWITFLVAVTLNHTNARARREAFAIPWGVVATWIGLHVTRCELPPPPRFDHYWSLIRCGFPCHGVTRMHEDLSGRLVVNDSRRFGYWRLFEPDADFVCFVTNLVTMILVMWFVARTQPRVTNPWVLALGCVGSIAATLWGINTLLRDSPFRAYT